VGAVTQSVLRRRRYISFGTFEVDQESCTLTRNGSRCRIGRKPYELLLVLLEKPSETVTRQELGIRLWPGETALDSDFKLNTTVCQLRKSFSRGGDDRVYVKTIARKGYAFVVDLKDSDEPLTSLEIPPPRVEETRNVAPKEVQQVSNLRLAKIGAALRIVGLFLAAVLLGAGIARLWISH